MDKRLNRTNKQGGGQCKQTRWAVDGPKKPVGSSIFVLMPRSPASTDVLPFACTPLLASLWAPPLRVALRALLDGALGVCAHGWDSVCRTSCRLLARPSRLLGHATLTNAFVPHIAHADVSRSFRNEHPLHAQRCVIDSSSLTIAFPADAARTEQKGHRTMSASQRPWPHGCTHESHSVFATSRVTHTHTHAHTHTHTHTRRHGSQCNTIFT
jgi:hypothetical protein